MIISNKFRITSLVLTGLVTATTLAATSSPPDSLAARSLTELEQRLEIIDSELPELPEYSLRSGAGAIGYRSRGYESADEPAWVEIHFDRETPLDELILVPAVRRDAKIGFQSDAFPEAFRVLAGTENDSKGHVIAAVTPEVKILPRIAPLVIPTPDITASWIRIESTQLTPRAIDGIFVLQFAEIMAFNGEDNVALHREVTTSPNRFDGALAWDPRYVTDGFVPYIMKSGQGQKSRGYISTLYREPSRSIGPRPSLTLDLQTSHQISRIHLHPLSQGDTFPQATETSQGFPQHLQIEVATLSDFSDGRLLLDFKQESIYDLGPIMCWNFPAITARFVRLTAVKPYIYRKGVSKGPRIGFAEIEIFSEGENVALGKNVFSSYGEEIAPLSLLTDGHNLYGLILPIRGWLKQLARRHDLETERPLVAAELNRRYLQQTTNLRRMNGQANQLALGIGLTILCDRMLRMRQIGHVKERFSADLHDELGANLHAIGLLSELLKKRAHNLPESAASLLQDIQDVSKQSGIAVRYITELQEAPTSYTDLEADMERAADRILVNVRHELEITGEANLKKITSRKRVDLFLFYKECLMNICRHSSASSVHTRLTAGPHLVELIVRDNGRGLPESVDGQAPASLRRRAKLLGARVSVATPQNGGCCVTLQLRRRWWRLH